MTARLKWRLISKLDDEGLTQYIIKYVNWTTHMDTHTSHLKDLPNIKASHIALLLTKNKELTCRYYGHMLSDDQVKTVIRSDWGIANRYFKDHPAYKAVLGNFDLTVSKLYDPK